VTEEYLIFCHIHLELGRFLLFIMYDVILSHVNGVFLELYLGNGYYAEIKNSDVTLLCACVYVMAVL